MTVSVGPLGQITCVQGESFTVSGPTGDVSPGADEGFFVRDTRFLDHLEVRINGSRPHHLSGGLVAVGQALFTGYLPPTHRGQDDARILVVRRRAVDGGLHEEVELQSTAPELEPVVVELRIGTDFAYIFDVRHRRTLPRAAADVDGGRVAFRRDGGRERTAISLSVPDGTRPVSVPVPGGARIWLEIALPPGQSRRLCIDVDVADVYGTVEPQSSCDDFGRGPLEEAGDGLPAVTSSNPRLTQLLDRSARDLRGLVLEDPDVPTDRFVAAGSPWFLTLFGRDSLWTALMALPLDPSLAVGTLRALGRRQGERIDEETEEQPGKILHEVRRGALAERGDLPPNYYGSIDATPLFVILAHEAWRWGVDGQDLLALIPSVEQALAWMVDHGDADGDGLLEHPTPSGRGLVNQGWKDSGDGIRFADGTIARAPMALSEVQGYAFAAARGGAELLDWAGRPGGDRWRRWADDLAERFRARFWVEDARGPYPAVALDHDKRPVDSVASNMGHLLFTGMLSEDEADHVARRLTAPDMAAGFGLRTLSSRSGGFSPLSYHCGSVWPHDTAIAVWGLSRAGRHEAAGTILRQLLRAAPTFEYRLPELFAGMGSDDTPTPIPYPSACRPQAWAAGGALLLLRALVGLEPHVPDGVVRLDPLGAPVCDRLTAEGLRLGARSLTVRLRSGQVHAEVDDPALAVVTD